MRLLGIAREVERWFSTNPQEGVHLSIGFCGPGQLQSILIGDQFVATGSVIQNAMRKAWLSSNSSPSSSPNSAVDSHKGKRTPFAADPPKCTEIPSVRSVCTQCETSLEERKGRSDTVLEEMLAADMAQARVAFRFSKVFRAQCGGFLLQCDQYEKTLEQYSQRLGTISGAAAEINA
jgi:hypothetical protein